LHAKTQKIGNVEDGRAARGERGAPQGAVISPILANVYLHYVYDLWVQRWRRTRASGDMIVIRYAGDTIVGLQHEHEAKAFLDDFKERMRAFELALHPITMTVHLITKLRDGALFRHDGRAQM
jgi:retron-type reverse transcriptase